MKKLTKLTVKTVTILSLIFFVCPKILADTHYVSLVGDNTAPYTTWATAAHVIQDAVDAATSGDTVLVTNGVYNIGNSIPGGTGYTVPNRVLFNRKNLYMKGVDGPEKTVIVGQGPLGSSAIRCLMVWKCSPVIDGFTISNGHTKITGVPSDKEGGGVLGNADTILSNCIIRCNKAFNGGGVSSCKLYNCVVSGNMASGAGGGNNDSSLYNCRIFSNVSSNIGGGGLAICSEVYDSCIYGNYSHSKGGGIYACSEVYNCRIFDNYSFQVGGGAFLGSGDKLSCSVVEDNVAGERGGGVYLDGGQIDNCLIIYNTSGLLQGGGAGVFFQNSGFARHCTIAANDPDGVFGYIGGRIYNSIIYYNTLINYATTGTNWIIEYCDTSQMPAGAGNITNAPDFVSYQYYPGYLNDFHLKSTSPCINSGSATYTVNDTDIDGTDRDISGTDMGCYEHVPSPIAHLGDHYVSPSGNNSWPYSNWASASHNVQDAIDAAKKFETIHVAEGVYSRGFRTANNMKHRVAIKKSVKVRGTGDKSKIIIVGAPDCFTGGTGTNVIRCAYLTNGADLANVTLSNGFTRFFGDNIYDKSGGGALLDNGGTLSNCIVAGNLAEQWGGGVFCLFDGPQVNNCHLNANTAGQGGGMYCSAGGEAKNCLFTGNKTIFDGGGVYFNGGGGLQNCTISDNSADYKGGGVYCFYGGTLWNSIVYNNAAPYNHNWYYSGSGSDFSYSCTTPTNGLPGGDQCIPDVPMFALPGSDYHLLEASPCIDAGTNFSWMTTAIDLDGEPRIHGSEVDMGCYEFVPEPGLGLWIIGLIPLLSRMSRS